jgi:hypothetical protein
MKAATRVRALASALAMGGALTMAAPAQAQTNPPPEVLFVAPRVIANRFSPDTALVVGVYRCFGGQADHLWVSVKQGGPDPTAEGSGATSTAWYDTNIAGEPTTICDGRYHAAVVPVGRYPNKARLTSGQAWIQFCLVAPDPSGQSDFGIVASQSEWATVVGV